MIEKILINLNDPEILESLYQKNPVRLRHLL